jgi:hypothetical protein
MPSALGLRRLMTVSAKFTMANTIRAVRDVALADRRTFFIDQIHAPSEGAICSE